MFMRHRRSASLDLVIAGFRMVAAAVGIVENFRLADLAYAGSDD
jgi:hypothetical protein